MSSVAPIEPLVAVRPLDGAGPDVFTNAKSVLPPAFLAESLTLDSPPWPLMLGVRAIFGGFLLSQAVSAAQATAPSTFAAHSLQSTFLRPANSQQPIVYRVERISDGRSFASRLVRAVQDDTQLFVATVGLVDTASRTPTASYQSHEAMPDFGRRVNPDTISPNQTPVLLRMGYPQKLIDHAPPDPIDWRHMPLGSPPAGQDASPFRLQSFVRAAPLASDRPQTHLAALAFLTDEWVLGTPGLSMPDVTGTWSRKTGGAVPFQATLNHAVTFHDSTVRADEWLVSERSTTWADGGRVLVQQKLWSRNSGKPVLSCWQEGLVRLGSGKTKL